MSALAGGGDAESVSGDALVVPELFALHVGDGGVGEDELSWRRSLRPWSVCHRRASGKMSAGNRTRALRRPVLAAWPVMYHHSVRKSGCAPRSRGKVSALGWQGLGRACVPSKSCDAGKSGRQQKTSSRPVMLQTDRHRGGERVRFAWGDSGSKQREQSGVRVCRDININMT